MIPLPVRINHWITVSRSGVVKVYKKKPSVGPDEVLAQLAMVVPGEFFVRPTIEVRVTIPKTMLPSTQVDATVVSEIEGAVRQVAPDVEIRLHQE